MIKNIALVLTLLTISYPIQGANIFPNQNKICEKIESPCSFDSNKLCIKEVCGGQNSHSILDSFIEKHNLIGKKFNTLIDLQDFIKKNLPLELKKYSIHFVSEESSLLDYDFSIVFILSNKNTIIKAILY